MTSPISLLALLAGSDPVPATQPSAEDPAVFAAALIAAIQSLQAPSPAPGSQVPVTVEGEEEGSVAGEGAGEAEEAGEAEGAGVAGKADVAGKVDVAGKTGAAGKSSAPGCAEGDPTPAVPSAPSFLSRTAETGLPDLAATERPDSSHEKPVFTPIHVDVVSDEPAKPVPIDSRPGTASARSRVIATIAEQGGALTPVQQGSFAGAKVEVGVSSPRDGRPVPGSSKARVRVPEQSPGVEPLPTPAELKTHLVTTGERKPSPTGDKAGHAEEAEPEVTMMTKAVPVQLTMNPVLLPLPVLHVSEPPAAVSSNRGSAPHPEGQTPSPLADQRVTVVESSPTGSVTAQAQNARLAAQLAELVGDLNLTEFRVDLARRRVASTEAGGQTTIDSFAEPAVEVSVRGPDQNAVRTATDRTAVVPERSLSPAAGEADLPAQSPLSGKAPVGTGVAAGPVVLNAEVAEPPAPATSRPPSIQAEPTFPPLRQELPQEKPPPADYRVDRMATRLANREDPSEPAAPVSVMTPNIAARVMERNDDAGVHGAKEARNLPQDPTGNERPAGLADRVTVEVSDAEGRQTRIRVSVLGDQVRAVIVPPDQESARQLERRMDDLQTALARQGFAGSKVMVQQASEGVMERGGAAFAGLAGGNEGRTTTSPGRDQPAGDQRQGRNHREQQPGDGHRHPNGRSRDQGAEHRRR